MMNERAGFTLLPVVLAMTLVAAIAFLINRDNGVNARMIDGQDDIERARLAAEAGLQAANYVVQQKGCAGGFPTSAAPVLNTNFGGGQYSAYADRSVGSPLSLSATGTYNGTSVTLTRSTVYVYQSPSKSYTLQPGPGVSQDTQLYSDLPNRNYGSASFLSLDHRHYAVLIRFDLSVFPAGSRVIPWYDGIQLRPGAQLELYVSSIWAGSSDVVRAYVLTRSWLEGTRNGSIQIPDGATWNSYDGVHAWSTPGGDYASAALASTTVLGMNGWINWDVTDAATAWMSGVYVNNGFRLFPVGNGLNNLNFVASDNTGSPTLRPRMDFTYLLPCGATAPT